MLRKTVTVKQMYTNDNCKEAKSVAGSGGYLFVYNATRSSLCSPFVTICTIQNKPLSKACTARQGWSVLWFRQAKTPRGPSYTLILTIHHWSWWTKGHKLGNQGHSGHSWENAIKVIYHVQALNAKWAEQYNSSRRAALPSTGAYRGGKCQKSLE